MRALVSCLAVACVLAAGCVAPFGAPSAPSFVKREAIRFDTDLGPFTVLLFPEAAPKTVDLMRAFAREGYFAGREFNRVVPGHVIQVIDKVGGATEDARRAPLEAAAGYHFAMGAAGIARGEGPNSGGPEWFVMDFATSHLDGNFTVWGQVVRGLDVVHRAARVPSVDLTQVPMASNFLTDKQAVQAPKIAKAEIVTIDLPASVVAALPMQVAMNVRAGDFRHSLEWPHSLHATSSSDFTWFMRAYNATAPPAGTDVRIRVGGELRPVAEDPAAPGAFHWSWTPRAAGAWNATLVAHGDVVATLVVNVP